MWDNWVIDVTLPLEDGLLCFVPIENIGTPGETIVYGMNYLSDIEHFNRGRIMGFIHHGGQEAVEEWCTNHPQVLEALERKGE